MDERQRERARYVIHRIFFNRCNNDSALRRLRAMDATTRATFDIWAKTN